MDSVSIAGKGGPNFCDKMNFGLTVGGVCGEGKGEMNRVFGFFQTRFRAGSWLPF